MSKAALTRWKDIDPKVIVDAIFSVVGSEISLLWEKPHKKHSIWGKISSAIFKVSSPADRFWCYAAYRTDASGIQAMYLRRTESTERPNAPDDGYCFCNASFNIDICDMIACDKCNKWYHCICLNIDLASIDDKEKFTCQICTGDMTVPYLFRNSFAFSMEGSTYLPSPRHSSTPKQLRTEFNVDKDIADDDGQSSSDGSSGKGRTAMSEAHEGNVSEADVGDLVEDERNDTGELPPLQIKEVTGDLLEDERNDTEIILAVLGYWVQASRKEEFLHNIHREGNFMAFTVTLSALLPCSLYFKELQPRHVTRRCKPKFQPILNHLHFYKFYSCV